MIRLPSKAIHPGKPRLHRPDRPYQGETGDGVLDQTHHAKPQVELKPEDVLHGYIQADDVKTLESAASLLISLQVHNRTMSFPACAKKEDVLTRAMCENMARKQSHQSPQGHKLYSLICGSNLGTTSEAFPHLR